MNKAQELCKQIEEANEKLEKAWRAIAAHARKRIQEHLPKLTKEYGTWSNEETRTRRLCQKGDLERIYPGEVFITVDCSETHCGSYDVWSEEWPVDLFDIALEDGDSARLQAAVEGYIDTSVATIIAEEKKRRAADEAKKKREEREQYLKLKEKFGDA